MREHDPLYRIGEHVRVRQLLDEAQPRGVIVSRRRDAWGDWQYRMRVDLPTSTQRHTITAKEFRLEPIDV